MSADRTITGLLSLAGVSLGCAVAAWMASGSWAGVGLLLLSSAIAGASTLSLVRVSS